MHSGTEKKWVEAGRRVACKVRATPRVCAFIHDGGLPSLAWEFQGRIFLGIVHRFGGGFGFWPYGFGLFFSFGHKLGIRAERSVLLSISVGTLVFLHTRRLARVDCFNFLRRMNYFR
jgi:hypothetical protein